MWSYSSSLEVSMKSVPVILLFTDQLTSQEELTEEHFPVKTVQVRKSATYGDLKKRIADCTSKILGLTSK